MGKGKVRSDKDCNTLTEIINIREERLNDLNNCEDLTEPNTDLRHYTELYERIKEEDGY